jgi:hypothetical protein
MSKHLAFSLFLFILGIFHQSFAQSGYEIELEQLDSVQTNLDTQRQWSKYRYDLALNSCYKLFFMQRCIDKARVIYLNERKAIRDQETALHAHQLSVHELMKNDRDQLRIAEYNDPQKAKERAANRAAFEEKQRLREERIRDLEQRRKDAPERAQENHKSTPLD